MTDFGTFSGGFARGSAIHVQTSPHHASTEAEGLLNGLGRAWEGRGLGYKYFGEGLLFREQARAQFLENRKVYWAARGVARDEYRERHYHAPMAKAKAAAEAPKPAARKAEREFVDPRGIIDWPLDLLDPALADARKDLEADFRLLADGRALPLHRLRSHAEAFCQQAGSQVRRFELEPAAALAARQVTEQLLRKAHNWQIEHLADGR